MEENEKSITEYFQNQRKYPINIIDTIPWLPKRASISKLELKEYGMINLIHTKDKRKIPWVPKGIYKTIIENQLYIIEINTTVVRGQETPAWLIKPILTLSQPNR